MSGLPEDAIDALLLRHITEAATKGKRVEGHYKEGLQFTNIKFSRRPKSLSRVLWKYFFSLGKPASKFNGKAIESRLPLADRYGPFLGNVLNRQIDHLKDCLIGRKDPMIARHLA